MTAAFILGLFAGGASLLAIAVFAALGVLAAHIECAQDYSDAVISECCDYE